MRQVNMITCEQDKWRIIMRNRFGLPVFFFLVIHLISGCSGKKTVSNYILDPAHISPETAPHTYIVMGLKNSGNQPLSCLFSLNLNGENVGMQGISSKDAEEVPVGISYNNHVYYSRNENGTDASYLIWKIPASLLNTDRNEALVYITAIGGGKAFRGDKIFYYFDGFNDIPVFSRPVSMNLYPVKGSQNEKYNVLRPSQVQDEPPVSTFEGLFFTVEPRKVYYIGDISVSADVGHKTSDDGSSALGLGIKVTYASDRTRVEHLLKGLNINPQPMVDLYDRWAVHSVEKYYAQTRKQLKKK